MIDIAGYLDSMGGKPSAGVNWVMPCPFCGRNNHLYCTVEESEDWDGRKKPPGVWICFGCGERGREFAILMAQIEGVSIGEARATIGKMKMCGIRLRPPSTQVAKRQLSQDAPYLPPEYEPIGGPNDIWPTYLTERGVSKETALEFKLGVCRRHDRCERCKPRGGCPRNMSHRIILPIECPVGRSFQARAIRKDMEPRYLSGDNSGQLLFGWNTMANSDFVVLVEGPFDAVAVFQAGLPSAALMGKDIRDSQVSMLRLRRRHYVVALDPMDKDPLAIDSACKTAEIFDGRVAIHLKTDPGASEPDAILSAVRRAVAPLAAREMALKIRLDQLVKMRRR